MAVIELDGVTRRFGALTAVDAVDLHVDDGEIVGLLGHNGAGKTTLLRVINGLFAADEGTVRVAGLDPMVDGHLVRRRTGVLTEYPALDEYLSVEENLSIYAAISGVSDGLARAQIDQLLTRLGLDDKRHEPSRSLSAGMKQRVALARGLVHDPSIWLLDEPTTNLDPVAAREVRRLIRDSARERDRTVLLSTHNLAEADEICDRVAIMRHGRLLAVGAPAQLRRELGTVDGVVVTTDPGQAARVLAAMGEDGKANVLDDARVEVAGALPIPELVRRLVATGIDVHGVVPREPTLEDLYVSLHPGEVQA